MIKERIESFENKLTDNINKRDQITNNYNDFFIKTLDDIHKKMINKESVSEKLYNWYYDKIIGYVENYATEIEPYREFARETNVPLNYFYYLWLRIREKFESNLLIANGVHFIVALQGGGKSTLAYELIERLRLKNGKGAYINTNFELPRLDTINKKYYKHHIEFKLSDFFDYRIMDDEDPLIVPQKYRFNSAFENMVLDEWLTEMNHRNNRTKDYNNVFLALLQMIAHMRHQGMKRIYILSQIDNTDIQLLSMLKYVHEVEIDLDVDYFDWVFSGELTRHIKGWWVYTYGIKRNRKAQRSDRILLKKQYIERTADFEYFETLNQASRYQVLKEHQVKML